MKMVAWLDLQVPRQTRQMLAFLRTLHAAAPE
jgi:hypothetical protein